MNALRAKETCLNKRMFETAHAAVEFVQWLVRRYNKQQRVYQCHICAKYHLTSTWREKL